MGPKIPEGIQLLLIPKNHTRLSFRLRESQVKLGSDSSPTPPQLSSWFLLAMWFIFLTPRGTSESREVFQPTLQRKKAVQQCWSKPTAHILWGSVWEVSHHKTKWPRNVYFLSIMNTLRLKLMTNYSQITFQVLLCLISYFLYSLTYNRPLKEYF